MTQARRLSRRLTCPTTPPTSLLLVGDAADIEPFISACKRAGLDTPLEAVPHVDAAWDRLNRRGVYTGREQAPALLVVCRPERAGLLPFLRRLRQDVLLRTMPAVLLTEDGLHCDATESARVAPLLYFPRPETAAARLRLARELAGLLSEF